MVQFEFMKIAFYIWLLVIMGVGCVFSLLCNKYHKYPFTSAWLCGEVGLGSLHYSLLRAELKVSARWDSHPEALGKNPLPDSQVVVVVGLGSYFPLAVRLGPHSSSKGCCILPYLVPSTFKPATALWILLIPL